MQKKSTCGISIFPYIIRAVFEIATKALKTRDNFANYKLVDKISAIGYRVAMDKIAMQKRIVYNYIARTSF